MTFVDAVRAPFRRGTHVGLPPGGQRLVRWGRETLTAEVSTASRVLTWVLVTLAGLALWVVLFAVAFSGLQEAHAQHSLYARFRYELANGIAPTGATQIPRGAPVALLDSGAAGLHNVVVVEGTTSSDLRSGPGHVPGAALPGQAGYSAVLGRSTSFGAPFGRIGSLRPGDTITATTAQGVFTYVVQDVRRAGDPFPPALASGAGRLTLATSDGPGWRSGFAPGGAVFVDARLQGNAQPAASTSAPSSADGLLKNDTSGLYPMILWLQLLVVAAIGIVWAGTRWGRWQAWLVGTPIALAALWGATSEMWLLLPNVF